MYLLDTNVLSEFSRSKPHPKMLVWLDSVPKNHIAIPFSAVIEIQRGISNLWDRDRAKAKRLERWLIGILASDIHFLGMDSITAMVFGMMTMAPALADLWVPDALSKKPKIRQDLAIAATAIAYDAAIVSRNVRDFMRIGSLFQLPGLLEPISGEWRIPPAIDLAEPRQPRTVLMQPRAGAQRPNESLLDRR